MFLSPVPIFFLSGNYMNHKAKNRTCAPSEDSDQPAHSRSLIRIFTGRFLITEDATCIHADNEDPDQTVRMRRLIWVFVSSTKIYSSKTRIGQYVLIETGLITFTKTTFKRRFVQSLQGELSQGYNFAWNVKANWSVLQWVLMNLSQ